jgi:hypothetical protein
LKGIGINSRGKSKRNGGNSPMTTSPESTESTSSSSENFKGNMGIQENKRNENSELGVKAAAINFIQIRNPPAPGINKNLIETIRVIRKEKQAKAVLSL